MLPWLHASPQVSVVVEAEQLVARLNYDGLDCALKVNVKPVGAAFSHYEPPVAVSVHRERIRTTGELSQRERTKPATVVIANVDSERRHHSVKLTN